MKISQKAKNALYLGIVCSILYGIVYVARNVLGAETPQMIGQGFDEKYIGMISSAFFFFYAVGQLINGIVGDKIKAKYVDGVLRLTLPKLEQRLPEGRRLEIE